MREMRIHVMTLPALREKHRRNIQKFRTELNEWWWQKENELNDSTMK
jgi:hypothetical protein